jgi:signal transduction histidine kinase
MSEQAPVETYASYRNRLLAASIPATAAAVFGATVVWQGALGISSPHRFYNEWFPNLLQILVPIGLWLVGRSRLREQPEALLLAADVVYTAALVGRQLYPETSISGTALYVGVKMLVTALLVPWGRQLQTVSVAFTLVILYAVFFAVHGTSELQGAQASHRWLGPLLAGLLSVVGAAVAERVRRSVFEHERQLRASAEHLRQEVEVDEALARVGQELIALPDTRRILDALCRLTTEVLACDASHTYLWDAERAHYQAAAGYGDTPEQWEALRLVRYPQRLLAGFQQHIGAADVEQYFLDESPVQPSALLRQFDTRVVLCVALRRGGKLIGVQSAEHRTRRVAFTPQQVRIARGIAHLASLALETARLVEELEAADRLKSEFIATMSHELRSPLNIIIGYHELLLDGGFGPLTAPQRDPLHRADRSARELLDLINATLDLSRLEAKRITLELSDVAIADLMDELGRELIDKPDRPQVAIEWSTPPDVPRLRTDRVKLKMVLKNLGENALKFTAQGSVVLEAAARDDGVEFRISDTGLGIAREAQALIFEPFRQIDPAGGHVRGGAGLGLYIVKQLLAVLGGRITLHSEVGQGSTFRVWLPLVAPLQTPQPAQDAADPRTQGTGANPLRRTAG